MRKPNFSDEFKQDAVVQITERGYPVAEVSQQLGVSQNHALFALKMGCQEWIMFSHNF